MTQVATGGRKRGTDAGFAWLAFQRLDQRRFFAADVSPGTQVDLDVEIKPFAQNVVAQRALGPPLRQPCLQLVQHVPVLAAQVDQALVRTDHQGRDAHAIDDQIEITVQQNAVFEGARFAFVCVADHVVSLAYCIAAGTPLEVAAKACAATAPELGCFNFCQHAVGATGQRGDQTCGGRGVMGQQHAGAADVVFHQKPFRRPIAQRHALANQFRHLVHT